MGDTSLWPKHVLGEVALKATKNETDFILLLESEFNAVTLPDPDGTWLLYPFPAQSIARRHLARTLTALKLV